MKQTFGTSSRSCQQTQEPTLLKNENVDQLDWLINSCPSTDPQGLFDGNTLYTSFASKGSGNYRSYISKTDVSNGLTFIDRTILPDPTNPNGTQNFPRMAIEEDLMVVAWSEAETGNFDVFTSFAFNGDMTQLEDNKQKANSNTNSIQTNPDVKIQNGFVHLVWQDLPSKSVIYRRGQVGFVGQSEFSKEQNNVVFPN